MIGADALVLLSDIDGLYDRADPRSDPTAQHSCPKSRDHPEIEAMAGGSNAQRHARLAAACAPRSKPRRSRRRAGCAVAITKGAEIIRFARAALTGGRATWFLPHAIARAAYKAWIAGRLDAARRRSSWTMARNAALRAGKSLLPAGVTEVRGAFEKGDIRILDADKGTRSPAAWGAIRR
jgi:glutamate 5-kinase